MKECSRHRDVVVRYGPFHDYCPLCVVLERIQDAREDGFALFRAPDDGDDEPEWESIDFDDGLAFN